MKRVFPRYFLSSRASRSFANTRFLVRYPARLSGRISSLRSSQDIWPEMRTYRQTNGTKNANLEKNWRRVASGNACFKRTFDPNELSIQTHDSNELSIQTNVANELSIQTEIQTNFRFKRIFVPRFCLTEERSCCGLGPNGVGSGPRRLPGLCLAIQRPRRETRPITTIPREGTKRLPLGT